MRRVIVRYRVKPDRVEENEQLIEKVFSELAQSAPAGFRYASFKGDDGLTFIHFASIETENDVNPLDQSAAFGAFQKALRDRCDVLPEVVQLESIASFNFFD